MRGKILFIISICVAMFSSFNVFALSSQHTHTNRNGVELTEKEFMFVNQFYGDDFFETMTMDDYQWIQDLDINSGKVEIEVVYDTDFGFNANGIKRSPSLATKSKQLSIAKNCNSMCTVITNLNWLTNPTIRSYDLIGARFWNTSLANESITTKVSSSNGTEFFSNNKYFASGIGTSVKLPSGATNISVQQKFFVKPGGTVFASYQHSVTNINLQTSLSYTVGVGGYGNVFLFYGDAKGKFDQMNGVDIDL